MLSSANIQNIFDTSKKDNNRRVGDYSHSLVIPTSVPEAPFWGGITQASPS